MPRTGKNSRAAHKDVRWDPHSRPPPPCPSSSVQAPPGAHTSKRRRSHAHTHSFQSWQPAHLHRFGRDAAQWAPIPLGADDPLPDAPQLLARASDSTPNRLTVLTYNTWSSSPTHTAAQSRAVLALVRDSKAHLVALQEVTSRFFTLLTAERWLRDSWAVTTPTDFWRAAGAGAKKRGKEGEDEACVLLVRRGLLGVGTEVRMRRLERARDEGGKAAIALRLFSGGDERIRLATSHFTSLPDNASLRSRQYRDCLSFLSAPAPPPPASRTPRTPLRLLIGDFNASSAHELLPLVAAPHSLTDACPSAPRSSAPRPAHDAAFTAPPTFGHLYPLVTPHARKSRKPRRIDRVYFGASDSEVVRVRRYEHLGGERPLEGRDRTGREGKVWASDHEAVRIELELERRV